MKLLTKKLLKRFMIVGSQATAQDPIVIAKFFDPTGSWTWYATEYNQDTGVFFGLVKGFENELGYFSLDELQHVTGQLGLKIERDMYWNETPLSKI